MHRILIAICASLAVGAALPATASAAPETRLFIDEDVLIPTGDANGTFGPADKYPAKIAVSGLPGTVLGLSATVAFKSSGRPEDIDLALVGPNGAEVMLMSDACGAAGIVNDEMLFVDSAAGFLSSIGCESNHAGIFKPTNYTNEASPDAMTIAGGPAGPFATKMAALAGGSPNGDWKLFAIDDSSGVVGFEIDAWALRLTIEAPPPVVEGSPPAVPSPPPTTNPPVITSPPPGVSPVAAIPAKKKPTGRRARALARCYKKQTPRARRRCRHHARRLPV